MKPSLQLLARVYGIRPEYRDALGVWRKASDDALMAVLRSLGVDIVRPDEAAAHLDAHLREVWRCPLDPVHVIWDGALPDLILRLPAPIRAENFELEITLEDGERRAVWGAVEELPIVQRRELRRELYTKRALRLPADLPWGYHRVEFRSGEIEAETTIIRSPLCAAPFGKNGPHPPVGLFMPLYALRTGRDWGAGDYTDLGALCRWAEERNFSAVGTLPLLPAFLEEPFQPSPYAPVSRRFWSEFYVDPTAAPEFENCAQVRALIAGREFQEGIASARTAENVDYALLWKLKRPVLEAMAAALSESADRWRGRTDAFFREVPDVLQYARFRAVQEAHAPKPWPQWPEALRSGTLGEGEADPARVRFFLYAQLLAREQMKKAARNESGRGPSLYLDLALGAHPDGFDMWNEQSSFAGCMSVGAPPDPLFTGGQDWGFAPPHPQFIRKNAYPYFRACLAHHLSCAGILRIDHVMCFHRLFWIPEGLKAKDGVYVHYQAEEFYGILALESQRRGAALIGEDLGTVPGQVRSAMQRHGLARTYAMQLELRAEADRPFGWIPTASAACVNTHDLSPFAAFWEGEDIEERVRFGLLDENGRRGEHSYRDAVRRALMEFLRNRGWLREGTERLQDVYLACLRALEDSDAGLVLLNLEDLWGEKERQNMPGTTTEHANWVHRAHYRLEDFETAEGVKRLLGEIMFLRAPLPG